MLNWFKNKWLSFRNWVAASLPGWKTKITAALGAVSMFAGYMQEYVSGLPLGAYITPETIALVTGVLFTLAFWFRGMSRDS